MRQDAMRKHWAAGACLAALLAAGCAPSARVANVPAAPAVPAVASPIPPAASPVRSDAAPPPAAPQSARDVAELELAATRLQAQIERNISEYQLRPHKKFVSSRPGEERFARYEEAWRKKIEDVGNLNYPAEARGRIYGTVLLTVSIKPDGSVESVELDRSSGFRVLDQAAVRIVHLASPFASFPPEISRDTDLLVITRTWFFMRGENAEAALCVDEDWAAWRLSAMKAVRSELRYPPEAVKEKLEGTVSIELSVDAAGKLIRVSVVKSSGHAALDAEALAAARKAALPAGPRCGATAGPVSHAIPIVFRLGDEDFPSGPTLSEWINAIRSKVRSNLSIPAGTPAGAEAEFKVVQLPSGEVLSVQLLSSSGFEPYDEATQRAIVRSSPLPKAAPGLFQREFVLKFRPR